LLALEIDSTKLARKLVNVVADMRFKRSAALSLALFSLVVVENVTGVLAACGSFFRYCIVSGFFCGVFK